MNPKLRPLDAQLVNHAGERMVLLKDRLALTDRVVVLPTRLTPLLPLCDGTRDESRIRAAFELETGVRLSLETVQQVIQQLDDALLLDSARFAEIKAAAQSDYRSAPFRQPTLADKSYPADPTALAAIFDELCDEARERAEAEDEEDQEAEETAAPAGPVRGLICPHIDYTRGSAVYASTWLRAAAEAREAEVVVVFGTDHMGRPGTLTPTVQAYATPWGPLPLAKDVVEAIAEAIGPEAAFADELDHRSEHSIELAVTWLHYFTRERPVAVAPILCGGFGPYTEGREDPKDVTAFDRAMAALREVTTGRRTLFVAAADLAHIGPSFGDQFPLGQADMRGLLEADERRLSAACSGDPEAFLDVLRQERDEQRVCGLPPIYFTLRALGGAEGEIVAYAQCPADQNGTSLVSVAGVVFT